MLTLFDENQLFNIGKASVKRFDIPDAELTLWERFFEKEAADHYYNALLHSTPWKEHERKMYDKIVIDPRLSV